MVKEIQSQLQNVRDETTVDITSLVITTRKTKRRN
jgi:hypothetical protein